MFWDYPGNVLGMRLRIRVIFDKLRLEIGAASLIYKGTYKEKWSKNKVVL